MSVAFLFHSGLTVDARSQLQREFIALADIGALCGISVNLTTLSTCVARIEGAKVKVLSGVRPFNLRELHAIAQGLVSPSERVTPHAAAGSSSESSTDLVVQTESIEGLQAFVNFFLSSSAESPKTCRIYFLFHHLTDPQAWRPCLDLVTSKSTSRSKAILTFVRVQPSVGDLLGLSMESESTFEGTNSAAAEQFKQMLHERYPDSSDLIEVENSPVGFQALRHRWLREVVHVDLVSNHVTVKFPTALFPSPVASTLVLEAHSDTINLEPHATPCFSCPCHGALLAHNPTAASTSLLDQTLGVVWKCPTTGKALSPGECRPDSSVIRLGHASTSTLHYPPSSQVPEAILTSMKQVRMDPDFPIEMRVLERVHVASLMQSMLIGTPFLLTAQGGETARDNKIALAALVRALDSTASALVVQTRVSMDTGRLSPWPLPYLLLPSSDLTCLIGRRTPAAEEIVSMPAAADSGLSGEDEERARVLEIGLQAALSDSLPSRDLVVSRLSLGIAAPIERMIQASVAPPAAGVLRVAPPPAAPAPPPQQHMHGGHFAPRHAPPGPQLQQPQQQQQNFMMHQHHQQQQPQRMQGYGNQPFQRGQF